MAAFYRLTVFSSVTGSGVITITPYNVLGVYQEGDIINVSIVPDNGFTFLNWEAGGVVQSLTATFNFTMPSNDVFLFANYTGIFVPSFTYGTKYLSEYQTNNGTTTRIEIQPKGYVGSVIEKCITDVFFRFGNNNSDVRETIIGSSLDFRLPVETDAEFNEFLTADLRGFRVNYYRGYVDSVTYDFKWVGYLTTDVFEEPHLAPNYLISLTATDGLKTLEEPLSNVSAFGLWVMQNITGALRQTYVDPFPVKEAVDVFETRMVDTGSLFNQYSVNANLFYAKFQPLFYDESGIQWSDTVTIKQGLVKILSPWICRLFQWNGYWYILRLNELVKTDIKYNEFDAYGDYVSSATIDNDDQVLTLLRFDTPIETGELGYTEFNASLILGDVSVPELNEIVVEPMEGASWISLGSGQWRLKRWQYVRCTSFDGVRDNDICRIEYVSNPTSGTIGKFARFWGTANGIADVNISYIESNKESRIIGASLAIENANTISVGAKFQILRRGNSDPSIPIAGTHLVGVAVQINAYYLYETVTPNVYDWTLTPTIITFDAVNSAVFNNLEITNIPVPEDGDVQFRLYQLVTVSGTRHRYVIDWDDAYIQLEKNDALVNEAILGKAITDVDYPSIAPDYETYIGDALSNLSSAAIKLNTVLDTPVSELWSRDGVESLELLQIVLQDLANLQGKNNFRVRGKYYGNIDPTKSVIYNNHKYLVNSFVLNDWENSHELDLSDLGEIETT